MNEEVVKMAGDVLAEQKATNRIKSASLNYLQRNDNLELDITELKLELESGDTISIYYNKHQEYRSYKSLDDNNIYTLIRGGNNLYLRRKSDDWLYNLEAVGERLYFQLMSHYSDREWGNVMDYHPPIEVRLEGEKLLDHEFCVAEIKKAMSEAKKQYFI